MTIDLVTGSAGSAHIDGNKWGALNAGILGSADYVLQLWNQFNLVKNTSVQLTLDTGCGVMNGRQVVITAPETITVTPAAAGQQRNDLICLRYTYDQQARTEKATVAVVQGSPVGSGTPADPKTNSQSIINQSTTVHDYPLWRVRVNNTGASSLTRLFSVLAPMASAWDSLNQTRDSLTAEYVDVTMGTNVTRASWGKPPHVRINPGHKTATLYGVAWNSSGNWQEGWMICNIPSKARPKDRSSTGLAWTTNTNSLMSLELATNGDVTVFHVLSGSPSRDIVMDNITYEIE